MKDIIEFQKIRKSFPGVLALDDVSFLIGKSEIHAVVGENGAGKSTLMNILSGKFQPDDGKIFLHGKETKVDNPMKAMQLKISVVHQELKLCQNISVVENIFLGREKCDGAKRVNWRDLRNRAESVLKSLGSTINPNTIVGSLSLSQMQIVEIAKAISLDVKILILDEPGSALTLKEIDKLFSILKDLKEKGVTIIFISHRLDDVFKISDRISILRDGKYLGTMDIEETNQNEIVKLIAGGKLAKELSKKHIVPMPNVRKQKVLEVKSLTRGKYFQNVSFDLYKKEILGIYGMQGSGRTELMETIFGKDKPDSGDIFLFGKKKNLSSTTKAIQNGIGMVPEDRKKIGLFVNMNVQDNINTANPEDISRVGFVDNRKTYEIAKKYIEKLGIKVPSEKTQVLNLSGGNQQKVVIARWLASNPSILLLDELTRGIDVGAKAEIYKILRQLREEGLTILLVSSELPEILSECTRILVMKNGKIIESISAEEATKEKILKTAL